MNSVIGDQCVFVDVRDQGINIPIGGFHAMVGGCATSKCQLGNVQARLYVCQLDPAKGFGVIAGDKIKRVRAFNGTT